MVDAEKLLHYWSFHDPLVRWCGNMTRLVKYLSKDSKSTFSILKYVF